MNTQFIDFYKKYRLAITLGLSTFLLFLSTLWQPFIFVMLAFVTVSMVFFDVNEIMCSILYYLVFSGFLILFITIVIYTFLLLIIKYIIDVCKKRKKIYVLPLSISGIILLISALIFYEVNLYSALQGLLIIGVFIFIYLVFVYRDKIKANKCFEYLIYGLLSSILLSAIIYYIPIAKLYSFQIVGSNWIYHYVKAKDFIFYFDGTYFRLQLLNFHVNHLCAICVSVLGFIVYSLLSKNKKNVREIVLYVVGFLAGVGVGFMTMSKAFLALLVFIVLFALIGAIVIYKFKSLKYILPTIIGCAILIVIFRNRIFPAFNRLFHNYLDGNIFEKITTGRSHIWNTFINESLSSPLKLLFGVGLFTKDIIDIGPHNLYIFILYRFGIFGIIALGVLSWSYLREVNYKLKCSIISIFPLFVFLILGLQEACFDERLYFLVMCLFLAFSNPSKQLQSNGNCDKIEIETQKNNVLPEKVQVQEKIKVKGE